MMQKRSLWAVLAAVLLMMLATNGVMADEDVFTSGDYQYRVLEDGTAEIIKYRGREETLRIPEMLDERIVTSIGDLAFSYVDGSITRISIPDNVIHIGINPFGNVEQLKSIRVSPDHSTLAVIDDVLFDKTEKELLCYPGGKINKTYEIPQGICKIGDGAFVGCEMLTTVVIPNSVTSIGYVAFVGCESLTNIAMPDYVTSIGEGAFYGCINLMDIIIPDSVMDIGEDVFYGCEDILLTVPRDSYAAQYAKDNNLNYTYPDANDWLNN